MAKTQEELDNLKQEYEKLAIKLSELSEDELQSISGGTSHSSDTYIELGIPFDERYQIGSNHPVITTAFNSCNFTGEHCKDCSRYHSFTFLSGYCSSRSQENDPIN